MNILLLRHIHSPMCIQNVLVLNGLSELKEPDTTRKLCRANTHFIKQLLIAEGAYFTARIRRKFLEGVRANNKSNK